MADLNEGSSHDERKSSEFRVPPLRAIRQNSLPDLGSDLWTTLLDEADRFHDQPAEEGSANSPTAAQVKRTRKNRLRSLATLGQAVSPHADAAVLSVTSSLPASALRAAGSTPRAAGSTPASLLQDITDSDELPVLSDEKDELWDAVGVEIIGRDIIYKPPTVDRNLLQNVTFLLGPHQMCALMGASGAGKSTLLDVVSGRKNDADVTGTLIFNGHPRNKYFKRISAYVMQDDVFIPTLTVAETLKFAASLRIAEGTPKKVRDQRLEMMLDMLGIDHIRDSIVGDQSLRGISGGQRKRLSIGVEIVGLPNIIFLDEPTSGLDSEISFEVMDAVRNISDQNRTVCATIHQPSPETFGLFDHILLMAHGMVVYFGETKDVIRFFTSVPYNYVYAEGSNPADFIVKVAGGKFVPLERDQPFAAKDLDELYRQSVHYNDLQMNINDRMTGVQPEPLVFASELATSPLLQLYCLYWRGLAKTLRDTAGLQTTFLRTVFGALLMGSLFYQQIDCDHTTTACEMALRAADPDLHDNPDAIMSSLCCNPNGTPIPNSSKCQDCQEAVYNRFSVLFFAALFKMMGNMDAIPNLCNDRVLFYRERSAGAYLTLPYMATMTIVWLPLLVSTCALFSGIFYFLIGFYETAEAFMYFLLIMFLCQSTGFQFAQLLAAICPSSQVALSLFPASFIFFNVFAGFLIHIPDVPVYWSWAPVISFARWAIQGLIINEFEDQPQLRWFAGADVMQSYGFDGYTKWDTVYYMAAIILFFQLCTQLALTYIRHGKA